jgi:ATP-dependent RNA helicase RhlE
MNFNELNLSAGIQKTIKDLGYEKPTEIQEMAIPKILDRNDVIGLAQTGTGKTAAFALPIIDILNKEINEEHNIKALILCPTRELAIQNKENIFKYTKGTNLRCMAVLGGVRIREQIKTIKKGIDILIATPGRLVDLMNQGKINLSNIEIVVLDEADTMLDMGFIKDIKQILTRTPKSRQTLLFSATMPKEIMDLTNEFMENPLTIKTQNVDISVDKIEQEVYYVDTNNKFNLLLDLISTKEQPTVLIFTRTKVEADKVSKSLENYGVKTGVIHSGKRQQNRARALSDFKKGITRVLVATDIAARGIDINDLNLVINYDLPEQAESYVHRIGRTARAGKSGKAITLCSSGETWFLKNVEKLINLNIKVMSNEKYPMILKEERPGRRNNRLNNHKDNNKDNHHSNNNSEHKKHFNHNNHSNYDNKTKEKDDYSSNNNSEHKKHFNHNNYNHNNHFNHNHRTEEKDNYKKEHNYHKRSNKQDQNNKRLS